MTDALEWTAICGIQDIPRSGARAVRKAGQEPIAVFRASDDHIFAVVDRCPHRGGPLSDGLVHGHAVSCPLHGWNIDLTSGRAREPDEGCARIINVRVEDGRIYLALPAER
ncbi:nitrite reductase small subunit NirD [Allopusillimonas soli]|uniref:Nitrite reductase small subunit NirD n=1 Tax=Allopusillimonas soli TaxID=659016 RepID=A0A853FGB8_9BURK|nr:nitrite reductase small subunit NirD [Allopusillimonas soli]NYT37840.1 nitrite reductase small subunit NirD [Allopusillimonas soli]TEA73745.1 nitrite reductase small subunit NirD [Allopusillimonas soli]